MTTTDDGHRGGDDTDEQTPLLSPPETFAVPSKKDVGSKPAFYLSLALIGLFQAGLAAPVVPATALMENILCRRLHDGSISNCKDEAVQSELAMLKGITSLTFLVPGNNSKSFHYRHTTAHSNQPSSRYISHRPFWRPGRSLRDASRHGGGPDRHFIEGNCL